MSGMPQTQMHVVAMIIRTFLPLLIAKSVQVLLLTLQTAFMLMIKMILLLTIQIPQQ